MFSSKIKVAAGLLVMMLGASALSACGDSAKKTEPPKPYPKAWSSAGKKEVNALVKKLRGNDKTACKEVGFLNPVALQGAQDKYKWTIVANAIADCDAFGEALEIATFASSSDRETFVKERTDGICRRSYAVDAPFPGFKWATGDNWAVQGDSVAGVKKIAKLLGGATQTQPCSKKITLGWTRDGVKTVRAILVKVKKAKSDCVGFALIERRDAFPGRGVGEVPAAMGFCVDSQNRPWPIAAFGPKSQSVKKFTADLLSSPGACSQPIQIVEGPNWIAAVPLSSAPAVAAETGGVLGATCGA
jgi:hypothetical protein